MKHPWTEARLGDVCRIVPGFAFKSHDFTETGVPVVKIKNITGDRRVDLSDGDHIANELITSKMSKYILNDGDILLAMTGATAGKVGKLKTSRPALLNQRVAKIEPHRIDADFLWSIVSTEEYERILFHLADGAAQPNMSGSQIEGVMVPVPPPRVQRRIASILGAYDNLIEVNWRRIAVLGEMARRLFDEWFVHFQFPGHEGHAMVETEQGKTPEGWTYCRLDDIASVNDRTLRPADAPDRINYVDIASVSPGCIDQIVDVPFAEAPGRARRRVQDGSVIWSTVRPNRRSFAVVLTPPENMVVSTGFVVLDAETVPFPYLYLATTTDAFVGYLVGRATGSAYPAVTGSTFADALILVPPHDLLTRFGDQSEPLIRLANHLREANTRLVASRDLLLPHLISGGLSVTAGGAELERAA